MPKCFLVNFESNFVQSGAGQWNLNFPWLFINIQNFSKGGHSPWEFPRIILEWTHLWMSPKFSWKKVECSKYWWRAERHSPILHSWGGYPLWCVQVTKLEIEFCIETNSLCRDPWQDLVSFHLFGWKEI